MVLNRIWIGMFLIAMVTALIKLVFWQDVMIFKHLVDGLFKAAEDGFKISLFLTGALCMWLGFMKIGEKAGAIKKLTYVVSPLFSKIFPEVPKDHPAIGSMMMNISANLIGLDNAATPMGLKAMKELQEINPKKDEASNAQIMFMVLNASGLTILPVSILALRATNHSVDPSAVFLPILIATFASTVAALCYVAYKQKINLLQPIILGYVGGVAVLIICLIAYLKGHPSMIKPISDVGSNLILFSIIITFIVLGMKTKINIYDSFIEGAKEGFEVAVSIIPYLVAMLAAIGVFRACGAMDALLDGFKFLLIQCGIIKTEFVDALPVALMKPFSGSGARALMVESWSTHGVDSFVGKLAATFQGSTETTFYVLAVYFGSVKIKNTRYAATGGIIADLAGAAAAIYVAYLFYV